MLPPSPSPTKPTFEQKDANRVGSKKEKRKQGKKERKEKRKKSAIRIQNRSSIQEGATKKQ